MHDWRICNPHCVIGGHIECGAFPSRAPIAGHGDVSCPLSLIKAELYTLSQATAASNLSSSCRLICAQSFNLQPGYTCTTLAETKGCNPAERPLRLHYVREDQQDRHYCMHEWAKRSSVVSNHSSILGSCCFPWLLACRGLQTTR